MIVKRLNISNLDDIVNLNMCNELLKNCRNVVILSFKMSILWQYSRGYGRPGFGMASLFPGFDFLRCRYHLDGY